MKFSIFMEVNTKFVKDKRKTILLISEPGGYENITCHQQILRLSDKLQINV